MNKLLCSAPLALALFATPSTAQVADFPFFDGFESGALAPHWKITKQWGDGLGQVTTLNGPYSGSYHLTLDGPAASLDSNVTADLRVDLSTASSVLLEFAVRDYGDEYSITSGQWLGAGSQYYDGVFISDDNGVTWHEVMKLNDTFASGAWQKHTIDLDVEVLNAGMAYNDHFLIRFSWEDEFQIATDGFAFDEITLRALDYSTLATIQSSQPTANGRFGESMTSIADVNGDGFPEMAIGHPGHNGNRGRVEIYSGKDSALLSQATTNIFGDQFGSTIATLGDLNGDGSDEILVGAPYNDQNGTNCGAAYIFDTKTGGQLHAFYGDAANDLLGASLCATPDVDGDGLQDIALGIPGADGSLGQDTGRVRIYASGTYRLELDVEGGQAGEAFGTSVDVWGDLDGDGQADLIGGSPNWDLVPFLQDRVGAAHVYSTATGAKLRTFAGDFAGGDFGMAVLGAGDLTGDGVADFAVGAPAYNNNIGLVRFFSGADGSVVTEDNGKAVGEHFGNVLVRSGDIDGDGDSDLASGSDSTALGTARVYQFPSLKKLADIEPIESKTGFGRVIAPLGDINLDGLGDLAVASPEESVAVGFTTYSNAGRVRVASTASAPELEEVIGLHSLASGQAVLKGINLLGNLQVRVNGKPVTSTFVSPVETLIDLEPVTPGGFFDVSVSTGLGSDWITRGLARYPALYTEPTAPLGSTIVVELENGEPGSYVLAFSGERYAQPAPFEAWGWYYGLELNGVWVASLGNLSVGDTAREVHLPAPTEAVLVGEDFHLQAWTYQAETQAIGFTDTMTVTITN